MPLRLVFKLQDKQAATEKKKHTSFAF